MTKNEHKKTRKSDRPAKDTSRKTEPKTNSSTDSVINSLFNPKRLPKEAEEVLKDFDTIIQGILPLNSKQLSKLPEDIRELSHQLTDERDTRRTCYMNEKVTLSAYTRYFMWWNLVRLTRLFSNIDLGKANLKDGDACIDLGSGPLTAVISLWLSRPELRNLKLTWYCVDISPTALSLGEDLFLSVAARTLTEEMENKWRIIRVKGQMGTSIKEKAKLLVCANMFNEVFQSESRPLDFLAKMYSESLTRYGNKETSYLVIEPGIPRSARFISLLRDTFIRKEMEITAPCSHCETCPMDGRLLKGPHMNKTPDSNRTGKWCNFAFPVKNAPEKLQKLSAAAKIPKERVVLSFVFATPDSGANDGLVKNEGKEKTLLLRIASDPIKLKDRIGFYACSKLGLTLFIPKKGQLTFSGDLIEVEIPRGELKKDFKSGAVIIGEK